MLPRTAITKCEGADFLLFSSADLINNTLFSTGKWEDHILFISKFLLKGIPNPTVLDIGANLGAYSIPLAKHLLEVGGNVIAFEPQRIVYYQLCSNVILNRLDNFIATNAAVGEYDGFIELPDSEIENNYNIGGFSIEKEIRNSLGIEVFSKPLTYQVQMLCLNNFSINQSPSLIKIDVEGYELNVLKGSLDFLTKHNFPPILFEAWSLSWFENQKNELFEFINSVGYQITHIDKDDYIAQHPLNEVQISIIKGTNNMLNIEKIR